MNTKQTTSKEVLKDIGIAIRINDPATLVDGCRCETEIGHVCEICFTYDALRSARRVIERLCERNKATLAILQRVRGELNDMQKSIAGDIGELLGDKKNGGRNGME